MILTIFTCLLMASVSVSNPSRQASLSESISWPINIPFKEKVIEPLFLEGNEVEEPDQPPEGLQDIFDKKTPDAFRLQEQKK